MPSLQKYDDKETEAPSTPRSLLACKRAGVFAEDLVFTPLEQFIHKYKHKKIAQMHFDAREQDRQEDLQKAMNEYNEILTNGITESEYLIMGKATVLQPLVTQWAPPLGVDAAAVNAAAEKARLELLRANERFEKIQEFQEEKTIERQKRNDELQKRIEERNVQEEKRIAEQQRLAAERQERSEEERAQREREMQEKNERERREAEARNMQIQQRLAEFRELEEQEIQLQISQRDERKERAVEHFEGIMTDKQKKMQERMEQQKRLDYEREMQIKAREDAKREEQEEKSQEIRREIQQFEEEEAERKKEQAEALSQRMGQSEKYYEQVMQEKCNVLHQKDLERTDKIIRSKVEVQEEEEEMRKRVEDRERTAEERYALYHEDVLMQQELEKEEEKIENERRAKRAVRLAEYQQFQREMKTNEMRRKLELLEDQQNQKRAQTIGLVQAKSRLEAEKVKENFERTYLHKSAKSCTSSASSTPASRQPLSMRASIKADLRGSGMTESQLTSTNQRSLASSRVTTSKVLISSKAPPPTQNEILSIQNSEMQQLESAEKRREAERRKLLADAQSDEDRAVLMREFADERKKAAQSMRDLNEKHKRALDSVRI